MIGFSPGHRFCDSEPEVSLYYSLSALKKSGQLVKNYCFKCNDYCWLYLGTRFRLN